MKRILPLAAVVAFLAPLAAPSAWAQDPSSTPSLEGPVMLDDGWQLWFVELASPPTADGSDVATIQSEQSSFRAAATQAGIRYGERLAFTTLWNGLSLAVHPDDLNKIPRVPGVAEMYPVISIELPEVASVNEPALLTALAMTGADVVHSTLGFTGAGIKVGIIDTGTDYDHPDLGGDGTLRSNSSVFPTSRVVAGYDFVGDAFNGSNVTAPDPYPDDCNSHGTHVAGIVGASGAVSGVAPGVTFGVYRVFGCSGSTTADIMIAAMERALADGMDVVNMSISNSFQWPKYPTAAASDRLVSRGVVVCAAVGNSGTAGLYAGGAPGVGKKVIGVASFNNTHINLSAFSISPDDRVITYSASNGSPPAPLSGTYPMARTGTSTSAADACTPLPARSLNGKVALIRRGTCTSYTKSINAQNAGAVGVVIYNNQPGALFPIVGGTPPVTIPVVAISAANGVTINNRLATGPVDLTWQEASSTPNATGGLISIFSSWGPSPDLDIKPDLGAPGGFVRSTVPLEQGGYDNLSGTSMSTPHVAGAVALLLEARPTTPSNAVSDILQNSAQPRPFAGNLSFIEAVHHQGAGLLDIDDAIRATTRIQPGSLALGEIELGSATRTLTIANGALSPVTYDLAHVPAIGTGPDTFVLSFVNVPATVSFSPNPVSVPAGGTATVDVTVTPHAALADRSLFGGYIVFLPQDGGQDYRVPYLGLKGDYQTITAITSGGQGFPWLAKRVGGSLVNQPGGASYSLVDGDLPFIELHLDHQVNELNFEVFDANSGAARHRALRTKWFPRNTIRGSFFTFGWDGRTKNGNQIDTLPNGQYVMRVSVVKALGDDGDPAHSESWTSPVITLARPNLTVEGVWLSQSVVHPGDEVTVSASVRNQSLEAHAGLAVEVRDGATLLHWETIDLGAGEARLVQAPWRVEDAARHRLLVTVSSLEEESDFADNAVELVVTPGEVIVGVGGGLSKELALAPAQPNPSSGTVAFRFSLPQAGPATLEIFDLLGRRVKGWRWDRLPAGEHGVRWDGLTDAGHRAPAGALLYRIGAMGRTITRKAVRLE